MTGILFWNCRVNHPIAIALLETRRQIFTRIDIDRLIGRDWSFESVPAIGKSGGILLLWLNEIIKGSNIIKNKQFLLAKITSPTGAVWQLGAIYADNYIHRRRIIWDELAKLDNNVPTIFGGDFNCVLRENEKRGGKHVNTNSGPYEFANFITTNNLHEIPFTGNIFTWSNNQGYNTRVISRLDRVLLNSEACLIFPGSIVHHLTRIASDHAPLLLELDKLMFTSHKSRQKFEEAWMVNPNVHSIALSAWSKPVTGNSNKILAVKCARTIKALARWNNFNAKAESEQAKNLEKEINSMQQLEASRPLIEWELLALRCLVANSLIAVTSVRMSSRIGVMKNHAAHNYFIIARNNCPRWSTIIFLVTSKSRSYKDVLVRGFQNWSYEA